LTAKEKPRDKERARRKQRVSRLEYRKNGRGEREKERGERREKRDTLSRLLQTTHNAQPTTVLSRSTTG